MRFASRRTLASFNRAERWIVDGGSKSYGSHYPPSLHAPRFQAMLRYIYEAEGRDGQQADFADPTKDLEVGCDPEIDDVVNFVAVI